MNDVQGEVSGVRQLDAEEHPVRGRSMFLSLEAECSLGGLLLRNGLGGSGCRKSTFCLSQNVIVIGEMVKEVGKAKANLNSDWEVLLE